MALILKGDSFQILEPLIFVVDNAMPEYPSGICKFSPLVLCQVLFAICELSGVILLMKNSVPLDGPRSPAPAHCLRDSMVPVILPVHSNASHSKGHSWPLEGVILGYFEDSFKVFAIITYAASGWSLN